MVRHHNRECVSSLGSNIQLGGFVSAFFSLILSPNMNHSLDN